MLGAITYMTTPRQKGINITRIARISAGRRVELVTPCEPSAWLASRTGCLPSKWRSPELAPPPLVRAGALVCNLPPIRRQGLLPPSPHPETPMAESKKYEISVSARPQYVGAQSAPEDDRYVFAYTITIENVGTVAAQLISRHWIINDAGSQTQEVRGLGVVGVQPLLQPGEKFEYTSGCQIASAVGTMRGSYQMVAEDGTTFEVTIPEFTLAVPRVLH
jgi:ApaG protein